MPNSNTLSYYYSRVQREAGIQVDSSFPTGTLTDDQQLVIDCINSTLRELNNQFYLTFKQTEYTFTTVSGSTSYDLRNAPYSLSYFRVNRIAGNGLRRKKDDFPLEFLDYKDRDYLQPSLTGNSIATHYSAFGDNLLIYPAGDGVTQLIVRYYSRHTGTDTTGVTLKTNLSVSTDLTMLDDDWEDALVYGATVKVRAQQKIDEKFQYYLKRWEDWRRSFIDMQQPGEDGYPQMIIGSNSLNYQERKIGPLFNANF